MMKSIQLLRYRIGLLMILSLCWSITFGQSPIAQGKPKWLGNIYSSAQVTDFTEYWNQVTPENAGKWGSVEGTRDVFNWGQLDAAYALAKDNGFPFRFHVLFWGSQQPGWIATLSNEEQLEEINEWMDAVAERYPEIDYLEVVNEPLHAPPSGLTSGNYSKALGGGGVTGWDWILEAFRLSREKFPNAQLMINDYNIVGSTSETTRYLRIIELLQEQNLIDAIGVQAHAFSTTGDEEVIKSNLDALAATGLPIIATEMDIDGGTNASNDDQLQLEEYQRIFPVFWEHPSVIGATLWGWRPGLWRNDEAAYLVRSNGSERPALEWLRSYVENKTVFEFGTVLSAANKSQIKVYPNPITTHSFELITDQSFIRLDLLNLFGQQVYTQGSVNSGSQTIVLDKSLSSGVYLLRLQSEQDDVFIKRLIIK
ncbi:endo-1,4-beta-xylanase [Marinoscillum pacificum]|uniref:endo-1,4-beta-xylanase n=1 Tax=Marinoscillum pacificum TaxID=392723 RepID=UPI0021570759|nr:endo-1,4-beta-xylanase [Marinoscillum pacificum]